MNSLLLPQKTEIVAVSPSDLGSDSSQGSKHQHSVRLRRPPSSHKKSSVLDAAYDEFCRRREAGETLDPDDFCARYPRVQSSLARLIEAHRFLEDNSHLLGDEAPQVWPQSGEEFAGFSLLGELGQGAFARVFQAEEPALGNRLVAVKISPEASTEAAILGRINHPHIVPVFSVREEPATGLSVVCMPYLGSATLGQVLDRVRAEGLRLPGARASLILEAIREPDAAQPDAPKAETSAPAVLRKGTYVDGIRWISMRLAEALTFIHAKGICHRDLKPSNVLMKPDGTPMLLDFNLSSDETLPETRMGGTPLYMAPEQLRALDLRQTQNPPKSDGRADLFSLGVILYELLTGTHPFGPIPLKLSSAEMRRHLLDRQQKEIQPIRQLNPAVDRGLAQAIEACLERKVETRPASAGDLLRLLKKSCSPMKRVVRMLVRHPRIVAAASLLIMSMGATGAYNVATAPAADVREFNEGSAAYENGEYKQAFLHLTQALEANNENAETQWLLGRTCQKLGKDDPNKLFQATKAYENYEERVADGRGWAAAGFCYSLLRNNDSAVICYEKAAKAGFASAEMANHAGFLRFSKKSLNSARKWFEEAIRLDPKLTAAHYNMARLCLEEAFQHGQEKAKSERDDQHEAAKIWKQRILARAEEGLGFIKKAMELGPVRTDVALDAGRLAAVAAAEDPRWADAALDYLLTAMELGLDPAVLRAEQEGSFRALVDKPLFQDFCKSQPIGVATRLPRFSDPITP